MIKTADIIETKTFGVVIAVENDGLEKGNNVYVQMGDGYFQIVQNGVLHGHVENVPEFIFDVLLDFSVLNLVEVYIDEGKKKIGGIYPVVLNDIRNSEEFEKTLLRWKHSCTAKWKKKNNIAYRKHINIGND